MGRRYSTADVVAVYEGHPLSAKSIVDRVQRQRRDDLDVTELDLACDGCEGITDQNHVGGALSTLRLGSAAGVHGDDVILDLGCGIGGPLRLLAAVHGCRGHGLDANASRIAGARELSALVGLSHLVTFESADFLDKQFSADYSVVWGQNAWIHIDEPERLATIAASALRAAGRLAFEDVVLCRQPASDSESRAMECLLDVWRSSFSTLDAWLTAFEAAGFSVVKSELDPAMLLRHFEMLTDLADNPDQSFPSHEVSGWQSALLLARSGVISYGRVIATLRDAMCRR